LLAKVLPLHQIQCLSIKPGVNVWEGVDRQAMKEAIYQLPNPEAAWHKFLDFDARMTRTIEEECRENRIKICRPRSSASVEDLAKDVACLLRQE
jgi:hypothetical protein